MTITGLPVASTLRASASWLAGSSRSDRLRASPDRSKSSPMTSSVTSALRAISTAAGIPERSVVRGSAPGAERTFNDAGAALVIP
jgi:hypothetical protein